MKLRFNREEMADALRSICAVAAARTPKPILRCVHLQAKSDVLLLSATDLEVSVRCAVTQIEVDQPGEAVVVADTLSRIVSECNDELLSLELAESQIHLRGEGSHFQVVTMDAKEFPAVPAMVDTPDIAIPGQVLKRMIEWTLFAAAKESTRYAINGVLWELNGKELILAATDGRRLSLSRGELETNDSDTSFQIIVPSKAMNLLARLPGDGNQPIGAKMSGSQLMLSVGSATIGTALVEGHFPKYEDVIPKDCDRTMELKTDEFLGALRRAALLTNEESKGVKLSLSDGNLTLSSRAPEQGEATVSISVKYKGESLDIGFNPVFLTDVLRVTDAENLTMSFKDSNRPGLIKQGEAFTYVVMPVNLTSA